MRSCKYCGSEDIREYSREKINPEKGDLDKEWLLVLCKNCKRRFRIE